MIQKYAWESKYFAQSLSANPMSKSPFESFWERLWLYEPSLMFILCANFRVGDPLVPQSLHSDSQSPKKGQPCTDTHTHTFTFSVACRAILLWLPHNHNMAIQTGINMMTNHKTTYSFFCFSGLPFLLWQSQKKYWWLMVVVSCCIYHYMNLYHRIMWYGWFITPITMVYDTYTITHRIHGAGIC